MNHEFKTILDNDEKIIKTFKPNKLKFSITYIIYFLMTSILFIFPPVFMFFVPDENGETISLTALLVVLGLFGLVLIFLIVFINVSYKKRYYAYSNKRILVQNGFIGVDFKSLDHHTIGATEVRVDFVDKLIKKNTGSLKFGSHASPMSGTNQNFFAFGAIEDPYEVYREIKNYIDKIKQEKKESL